MKNYFISRSNVAEFGEVALRTVSQSKDCISFKIGDTNGWLVESSLISGLLASLDAKMSGQEKQTSYDGVFFIGIVNSKVVSEEERPKVTTFNWNDNNTGYSSSSASHAPKFRKIAEEILLPALKGRSVEISVPRESMRASSKKKEFQIFIWSGPLAQRLTRTPEKIWGIAVDIRSDPFKYTEKGVNIQDDDTGYSVAELVDQDILYVHHHVAYYGTPLELAIWKLLLQKVVEEFALTPEEKVERDEQRARERAEKERKELEEKKEREKKEAEERIRQNRILYIEECKTRLRILAADLNATVQNSTHVIGEWQTKLIRSVRDLREAKRELEVSTRGIADIEQYGTDFEEVSLLVQKLVPALELEAAILKQKRDLYVQQTNASMQQAVKDRESTVNQLTQQVRGAEQSLLASIRNSKQAAARLEALKIDESTEVEKYGKEYDRLIALSQVKSVIVRQGFVVVLTDVLYCNDPDTKILHEIGAFEISIPTNGAGGVRWKNLTRSVNAYNEHQQAPHIWSNGAACLGNTAEIFAELIARYEFSVVAMIAIQFVESVNKNDPAGKHITRWPVAQPKIEAV